MLLTHFKLAFRNLRKNKLFTTVNIIGLSVGIASIMALSFSIYQYITTDRIFAVKEQMYYLKTAPPGKEEYMQTTYPLLGEIVKGCPEVEAATHAQGWNAPWLKYGEKEVQQNTLFVDSGFLKVFTFPLKYGNAATAFSDKFNVVLSDKVATQLFGDIDPVGKSISADDSIHLTVSAVLQPVPANASVQTSVLLTTKLLMDNPDFRQGANWYNTFAKNFLRLKAGTNIPAFSAKINEIVQLNYAPENRESKIKAVSFSNIKDEGGPLTGIIIKGSLSAAIFILIIIVFNLINLNAATMYNRAKEVGVRQMMGSGKKNIILQFCIENGLLVFVSLIAAALLFNFLLLPQMNQFISEGVGESLLSIKNDYPFLLFFVFIGALITMLAGSLPAVKLSTLKVTDTVKGKLGSISNTYRWRNVFIKVQFALAITFIGITVILNRQLNYMKHVSVGFNKENVVVVNTDLSFKDQPAAAARFESIVNELKANPYVKALSTNTLIPTRYWSNYNTYIDPSSNREISLRHASADAGYLPTFEVPMVMGNNFDDNLAASQKQAVIINETAMKAYGWKDIAGKTLRPKGDSASYAVIGVMKDFNYQTTQDKIEPLLHWYNGKPSLNNNNYLSINIAAGHGPEILKKLEQDFKTMPSRRPFKYTYMSELVSSQYKLLNGILSTTNFIAFLTILVAGMGMFGLISLMAKQKVKEIGVRKVLGASVQHIVSMLSADFLKLVVVACIVALPACWFIMNRWLTDFAYRITVQWWMLIVTAFIAILIALFTVGFQSIRAALINPVKSLKSE